MVDPYVDIDACQGDSTHVKELALGLSKCGCDVTLIAGASQGSSMSAPNLHFKNVSICRRPSVGLDIFRVLSSVKAFLVGFYVLLTSRIDVIHERQPFPVGLALSKIFQVMSITEVNSFIPDELVGPEFNRRIRLGSNVINRVYRTVERMILNSCDRIVAITPELKATLEREYGIPSTKIFVVANGVNPDLFHPASVLADQLGLDPVCKYICFVGNLHKAYHGLEYLIEAARLVLRVAPNTGFIIIGDGVTKAKLSTKVQNLGIADRSHFLGSIPYDELPSYINVAAVCVAPFGRVRNEKSGLSPLKIYEYLACGKPVVASDIGGIGSLLRASNAGIAVRPEDPQELASALLKLLTNQQLARTMGESGRRLVVDDYSWEAVAGRLLQIFASSDSDKL